MVLVYAYDSGGMRRSWLRGLGNVTKRYLIATAAHNLGRILRKLFGVGKPKVLQGSGSLAALMQLAVGRLMTLLVTLLHWIAPPRLQHAAARM
jgi:transposase